MAAVGVMCCAVARVVHSMRRVHARVHARVELKRRMYPAEVLADPPALYVGTALALTEIALGFLAVALGTPLAVLAAVEPLADRLCDEMRLIIVVAGYPPRAWTRAVVAGAVASAVVSPWPRAASGLPRLDQTALLLAASALLAFVPSPRQRTFADAVVGVATTFLLRASLVRRYTIVVAVMLGLSGLGLSGLVALELVQRPRGRAEHTIGRMAGLLACSAAMGELGGMDAATLGWTAIAWGMGMYAAWLSVYRPLLDGVWAGAAGPQGVAGPIVSPASAR
jgi:hypothetical protein